MKKHEQKDQPVVTLRLVNPDAAPDAPLEERMDLERTRELHKQLRAEGKTPKFVEDAIRAIGLVPPTPQDVKWVEQARAQGFVICGNCRHFDYAHGQEVLESGGAWSVVERMGAEAAKNFGDWRRYGACGAHDATLTDFNAPGWSCPEFEERKKTFGRILGGVWRRINDI